MKDPIEIRDLPAADRALARRVRLWYIRTISRRGGVHLTGRNPSPGQPLTIDHDAIRVGRQIGSRIIPRMNRTEWREHARKCRAHGMTMPKNASDAEVAANLLRKVKP